MIVFEGKAFDEKKVIMMDVNVCNQIRLTMIENKTLFWDCKNTAEGISKVNEIAALINKREEEILKLQYHS